MTKKPTHDEQVARLAIDRLFTQAQQVARMRGTPPEVRATTPEEELALWNHWDDAVDPIAVMGERYQHWSEQGLPPGDALVEATLEAAAAGFKHRLKMMQADGRLTLTEQAAYGERLARRAMAAAEQQAQQPTDLGAPPEQMPVEGEEVSDGR